VDFADWPELAAWAEKMKKRVNNYDEANDKGVQMFKNFWLKRSGQA